MAVAGYDLPDGQVPVREAPVEWWRDAAPSVLARERAARERERPEHVLQAQAITAHRFHGFTVTNFSQARETRQTLGIPDTHFAHPDWPVFGWIEWKVPEIRAPGARAGTTRIVQEQGKCSWEQWEWQQVHRRAGVPVITADSIEMALAWWRWLCPTCPLTLEHTRGVVYDPESQWRFHDPRALPQQLAQARARANRKSGPRVQYGRRAQPRRRY